MKKWKKSSMRGLALLFSFLFLMTGCGNTDKVSQTEKQVQTEATVQNQTEVQTEVAAQDQTTDDEEWEAADQETSALAADTSGADSKTTSSFSLDDIPEFSGEPYVVLNDNEPEFTADDYSDESYETYSPLDDLGRCGPAIANIGQDLMPTEKRSSISQVKPTGWHSVQYDNVDGKSLYNRCHLIGYQLTAENANKYNLITGTRYLNTEGMLPFENMVTDYIKETGNHVLYRVTPIFQGDDLVARGVQMEAKSVEDDGDGICFNIYAYNNQPGIEIDYATGESWLSDGTTNGTTEEETAKAEETQEKIETQAQTETQVQTTGTTYVLNTNTKKFHYSSCSSVKKMNEQNKETYTGDRDTLISQGYEPCKNCNP
jgi:DNA-entry nuclease